MAAPSGRSEGARDLAPARTSAAERNRRRRASPTRASRTVPGSHTARSCHRRPRRRRAVAVVRRSPESLRRPHATMIDPDTHAQACRQGF